jgi:hypothetical protein
MLKKLLLTVALLSSTYGAEYVDPEFTLLANRSETLVVNKNSAVIKIGNSEPWVLHRLTPSKVSKVLSSNNPDVQYNALTDYFDDIWRARLIYIELTADCTPNRGYSQAQDAEFLCKLFWGRVESLEQLMQVMLLSPQIIAEDPNGLLKQHQEKLAAFSKAKDHTDITPFTKAAHTQNKKLFDEFRETFPK